MSVPDTLSVTLTACRDRRPLLVVHNLPGPDAEMRPDQARGLAAALIAAADACDARPACLDSPKSSRRFPQIPGYFHLNSMA